MHDAFGGEVASVAAHFSHKGDTAHAPHLLRNVEPPPQIFHDEADALGTHAQVSDGRKPPRAVVPTVHVAVGRESHAAVGRIDAQSLDADARARPAETGLQSDSRLPLAEGRKKAPQVARRDGGRGDAALKLQRGHLHAPVLVAVGGGDRPQDEPRVGQFEHKVFQRSLSPVGLKLEVEVFQSESRPVSESQHLHVGRDGRVGELVEHEMAAQVGQGQMVGIECARCEGCVAPVVADGAAPHHKRVDAQVEGRVCRGVFRGQRVEHKLVVGLRLGIRPVESGVESEYLRRRDGNAPLAQCSQFDFGRESRSHEHRVSLPVEYHHLVDDDTVEKPQIDAPHGDRRAQFLADGRGNAGAEKGLHRGYLQKQDDGQIDTCQCPDDPVGDMFKFFQMRIFREFYCKNTVFLSDRPTKRAKIFPTTHFFTIFASFLDQRFGTIQRKYKP